MRKARMTPGSAAPLSTRRAPTSTTRISPRFMNICTAGAGIAMTVLAVRSLRVRRRLTSWKRRSSQASLRRALMTRTPAAFSRMTRVIRSTSCCTRSYRGTPFRETKITMAVITGASTHSTEASAASMVSATHTPPTSMMGARTPTVWLEVIKF